MLNQQPGTIRNFCAWLRFLHNHAGLRLAVDIGGVFTDTALNDGQSNTLATTKTPTAPDNPTAGALTGAKRVLENANASFSQVSGFIHSPTLATIALIERRVPRSRQ